MSVIFILQRSEVLKFIYENVKKSTEQIVNTKIYIIKIREKTGFETLNVLKILLSFKIYFLKNFSPLLLIVQFFAPFCNKKSINGI